jgi:hypothetical protein
MSSLPNQSFLDVIADINNCLDHRVGFANDRTLIEYFERNFKWCIPEDLKRTLDNYYYSNNDDPTDVHNAQLLLRHSQKYADMIETLITSYFSSLKSKFRICNREIQRTLRDKGDYTIYLNESAIRDTDIETSSLKYLSTMPSDVIALVSEYALNPFLKYILIKSECGDLATRLNLLKLPNLKCFGRVIQMYAGKIYGYLINNVLPIRSIKKMCNISSLQLKLSCSNKNNIILYIIDILNCCDDVIHNFTRRNAFHKTRKWLIYKTIYLYKCIIFVSRPEFNSRKISHKK